MSNQTDDRAKRAIEGIRDMFPTAEQFVAYCGAHSESDRALFHADHIYVMQYLAGVEPQDRIRYTEGFYAVHSETMHPFVDRALLRLKQGLVTW
jgi:hypothetical protein